MTRRSVLRTMVLFGLAALSGSFALAQEFPTKPVRIVTAFPAGAPTDVVSRLIGHRLSEAWGQPVIVENRPGAGGNIGAQVVAKSAPDGHTLLSTSNAIAVNVTLYRQPGYTTKDLVPVIRTGAVPSLLFAHPSLPVKNLTEVLSLAKTQPLSYASSGTGAASQLFMEWLKKRAGVDITHVPFTPAAAVNAVVGNQSPLGITSLSAAVNQVRAGKLKAIAVTTAERAASLPDVGTMTEAGFNGFVDVVWFGIFAPAGTPPAVVTKINAEINRALEMTDTRDKLGALGMDSRRNSQTEFDEEVRRDVAKYARVIQEIGAQAD